MSEEDHGRIVELSWALGVHPAEDGLITDAMERIFQIVGADEAVFNAVDLETGQASAGAYPEAHLAPMLKAQLAEVLDDHPVVTYLAATPQIRSMRISDILPFRQFERTRTYQTLFKPRALRHQLVIPIEVGGTRRAGMVYALNRCQADFGQREVDLAMMLQPVLAAHHASRRPQQRAVPDAQEARQRLGLTVREGEVLSLMAQGMTAVQIGHRLIIGVGTVRKHLENAYAKLDVHDRLEAVNRCRAIGLLT